MKLSRRPNQAGLTHVARANRKLAALFTLPMILLGMVLVGAAPAQASTTPVSCYGDYCSGQDPATTGCSADAVTVASHEQENGSGIVEVRWSPTCKTNWARWTQYPTGWCLNCGIVGLAAKQDTGYTQSIDLTGHVPVEGDSVWTPMIYSPVHRVKAQIFNICGDQGLLASTVDCALNGIEETPSV